MVLIMIIFSYRSRYKRKMLSLFEQSVPIKMMKFTLLLTLVAVSFGASLPEHKNAEIEEYIVGGKNTDISEVPYQVCLKSGLFLCGGSIVSPTMVVTAAHCVKGHSVSDMVFRAGSSKSYDGGITVRASNVWVHPQYNSYSMDYDVAVVELQRPLSFTNTIKPIKLATVEPPDGDPVKASGWGFLKENGPMPSTLQSVVVPVVNRNTCARLLSNFSTITTRMICAGVEGKDACQGDSGGPLNHNGQLVGIVSFGIGCARKDLPGVYTNVANQEITAFIRKHARI